MNKKKSAQNSPHPFSPEFKNLINIFDSFTDGVFISNNDFDIQYINSAMIKEFGPVNGRKCYEYFQQQNNRCPWCRRNEINNGLTLKNEIYFEKTDKFYELIDTPFINPDGSISVMKIIHDVTAQKKAADEIKNLAKFPSENPYPVIRISNNRFILYANTAGEKLLKKLSYGIGSNISDKNFIDINMILKSDIPTKFEIRSDNQTFLFTAVPVKDSGYINFYGYDITELKDTQTALKNSEERYKMAQKAANIGTWDWDITTDDLQWSDRIEPLFGFKGNEFKKTYSAFLECIHPDDREFVINSVNECIYANKEYAVEHRIVWPDRSIHWVSETGNVIRDENNRAVRMLGIVQDITLRKEAENILNREKENTEKLMLHQTKELDGTKLILDKTLKELNDSKRLSDIGSLAATVAHELRNPLGVILAAVYNINRKNKNPSLEKHIETIEKKIAESEQIINNLLHYSKLKMPNYERVNIKDLLNESLSSVKKNFPDYFVIVSKKISKNHTTIEADPYQLKEIFNNILTNAYQAMNEKKGKITIILKAGDNESVNITIKDNGIGIDNTDLKKVMDPFFTKKSKGTGLGLAICNELINLHNGSIIIESEQGKGTAIIINLPVRTIHNDKKNINY